MARRVITREFYEGLVKGFAAAPSNFAAAGRSAGCDARTAKRGWYHGWPKFVWAVPICDVIAEQQVAARALAEQHEVERRAAELEGKQQAAANLHTKAMLDMAREREMDGQIARAGKQNALACQATAMNLLQRGHKIAEALTVTELLKLPVAQRVRALKTIADFAKTAIECSGEALKLERLIMGEPTEIHAHAHVHTQVAPDEMAATIARATAAVDRARAAGLVLDVEVVPARAPAPVQAPTAAAAPA